MSMRQFVYSGLWAFGSALEGKTFKLGQIDDEVAKLGEGWSGRADDMPTGDTISRSLRASSLTTSEFADLIGDLRKQDEALIAYDYGPLLEFPLVQLSENEYICPIPKLLIDRFTDGLFHDFANGLQGTGRGNDFRAYFGRLFERYVGMQLALVFQADQLNPETHYGNPDRSTPDWVVNHPSFCLALECRSSTFTLDTRQFADINGIFRDLGKIGGQTIKDLWPKLKNLRRGSTPIALLSSEPQVASICTFESLEPIGLFGGLMAKAAETIGHEGQENFHLIPIVYLESMCAFQDPEVFFTALKALQVDETWLHPDGDPSGEWHRAMSDPLPLNPILEAVAGDFLTFGTPTYRTST